MALYNASRYTDAHSRDMMLINPDQTQRRTITRRPPVGLNSGAFHIWRAGDRLDRIANWAYGDPKQVWRILDLNPHILNGHSIEPGTVVRLP